MRHSGLTFISPLCAIFHTYKKRYIFPAYLLEQDVNKEMKKLIILKFQHSQSRHEL